MKLQTKPQEGSHPVCTATKSMAKKRSKRYLKAAEMVDKENVYSIEEAVALVKKFPAPKFDQSVTLTFRLGVDPKQSDQAKNAGADHVGFEALINEVQGGMMDFDAVIATPAAMSEVRKLGRQLGPRGLMPNPKTGTVTEDTAAAEKAVKAGRVDFKLDKNGNIAVPIGTVSFDESALVENGRAVIDAVSAARPASA